MCAYVDTIFAHVYTYLVVKNSKKSPPPMSLFSHTIIPRPPPPISPTTPAQSKKLHGRARTERQDLRDAPPRETVESSAAAPSQIHAFRISSPDRATNDKLPLPLSSPLANICGTVTRWSGRQRPTHITRSAQLSPPTKVTDAPVHPRIPHAEKITGVRGSGQTPRVRSGRVG